MTAHHANALSREARLASVITAITRRFIILRREGRPVAHLLRRSRQLSAAYLTERRAAEELPI